MKITEFHVNVRYDIMKRADARVGHQASLGDMIFKCDFVTYKVAERGYNKHRNEKKLSFL